MDRIDKVCKKIHDIWKENLSEWRFGQFMYLFLSEMLMNGKDIFFISDEEIMREFDDIVRKYK